MTDNQLAWPGGRSALLAALMTAVGSVAERRHPLSANDGAAALIASVGFQVWIGVLHGSVGLSIPACTA